MSAHMQERSFFSVGLKESNQAAGKKIKKKYNPFILMGFLKNLSILQHMVQLVFLFCFLCITEYLSKRVRIVMYNKYKTSVVKSAQSD